MSNYNERLDEILAEHREWMRGIRTDRLVGISSEATKQAITSLIKELVAEAKPMRSETQRGSVTVYGDLSERDVNIIRLFEQNLLKVLEEV